MSEKFEVDQVVEILRNDPDLNAEFARTNFPILPLYTSGDTSPRFTGDTFLGSYYLTTTGYSGLAEYYLANQATFTANTVITLATDTTTTSALWLIISDIKSTPNGYGIPINEFGVQGFTGSILAKLLIYSFKYSAIKSFFRQNYKYLTPEFDYDMINSQAKTKLYQEAFMREFDRFSLIIDNISSIVDLDKIPTEYLNYLAQIIGYEREDYRLLTNSSFRELLKNIIEIYRIKGSNYSFELFFNLLGFEIIPEEFWFDRRFGDTAINNNPYTSATDKNSNLFYLTPNKPTEAIPSGMSRSYSVTQDQIKKTMDLNYFDVLTSKYVDGDSSGYAPRYLTGNTSINISNNLQAHWRFVEGTGDSSYDSSSYRRNLILNNLTWSRKGTGNTSALHFGDRLINRYARTADTINFGIGIGKKTKQLTITFWASKEPNSGDTAVIFSHDINNGITISANNDGSGTIVFRNAGVVENISVSTGIFDSVLRFYAITYNSISKRVSFYKNSIKVVDTFISSNSIFGSNKFYIGNYSIPSTSFGWVGVIDEFRIYDRELTEYEIKHLYAPLGDTFTYFKSNIIQYSIASLRTGQEANLTSEDLTTIVFYSNFLSPIFVEKNIVFKARPSIESAITGWTLLDADRTDPIYINRSYPSITNRFFAIQSVEPRAGDTFCPRAKVVVSDPLMNLISYIHPTGDSLVGKYVLDRIILDGTTPNTNDGNYQIAGDTVPPTFNNANKTVTIYLKGDTNIGIRGTTKTSPTGYLYIGGPDKMFHLYQGRVPKWYYADSGLIADSKPPIGGHWISGFHNDTFVTYNDPNTTTSVYSKILAANPLWSEEQVREQMRVVARADGDSGLSGNNYRIRRRDVFLPIDASRFLIPGHYVGTSVIGDTGRPTSDSWVIYRRKSAINSLNTSDSKVWWRYGAWINAIPNPVEYVTGNFLTLGGNHPLRTWDIRPNEQYYQNFNNAFSDSIWIYNTGQVFFIDADNGSGRAVIRVLDHKIKRVGDSFSKFRRLVKGDLITLVDTKNERNNLTRRVFSTTWTDGITSGRGDTTIITVEPTLPGGDQINIFRGYVDFEQAKKVRNVVRGVTKGTITIFDGSQSFRFLRNGDTIQLVDTGDTNEGIYITDSVGHWRGSGDSGFTTIVLKTILNGATGDSKGLVRLYSSNWNMSNPNYVFMFDKLRIVEKRVGLIFLGNAYGTLTTSGSAQVSLS